MYSSRMLKANLQDKGGDTPLSAQMPYTGCAGLHHGSQHTWCWDPCHAVSHQAQVVCAASTALTTPHGGVWQGHGQKTSHALLLKAEVVQINVADRDSPAGIFAQGCPVAPHHPLLGPRVTAHR